MEESLLTKWLRWFSYKHISCPVTYSQYKPCIIYSSESFYHEEAFTGNVVFSPAATKNVFRNSWNQTGRGGKTQQMFVRGATVIQWEATKAPRAEHTDF